MDHQDEAFSSAFSVLREATEQRAFPAACAAVVHRDRLVALKSFGHFTYDVGSPAATPATVFDLASVTKVVATTTMAMILYERGLLKLEATVAGTVPEFLADSCGESDARRREVTFRMLLAHSSGLPAYEKLFLKTRARDELAAGCLYHFPFRRSRRPRRIQRYRIHPSGSGFRTDRERIARRFLPARDIPTHCQ